MPTESDEWKRQAKRKQGKKTYRLEYRMRPERRNSWSKHMFPSWYEWRFYHTKYRTPETRKKALQTLNRKDTLFEYRIPE